MALITGRVVFSSGATIYAADQNTNDGTIWNEFNGLISNSNISSSAAITYSKLSLAGSIVNADISASAAIAATKLATISTAGKVSGAALTSLSSTPSGAGIIPIANLASGSATGSKFIRDDGSLQVPPSLSNLLFCFNGGDTGYYITSSSLTPVVSGASNYMFWTSDANGNTVTVLNTKFVKRDGVSTATVWCRIWQKTTSTARCIVTIGSASANIDGTSSQTTPEWKNGTVDVSGLSNGTTYDVTIQMSTVVPAGGVPSYLSTILAFGS